MELVPLKAECLAALIKGDPACQYLFGLMKPEHMKVLEEVGASYMILHQGKPLICGGVTEYWKDRGECWAVLDQNSKTQFLRMHKMVRKFLDTYPIRRIELAVDVNFTEGHRWARLLGFEKEANCMRAFSPDGRDHALYARVRR